MSDKLVPFDKILEHFGGDQELLVETIGFLNDTIDDLFAEITKAKDASDPAQMGNAAHTLKGAISNFLIVDVVAIALEVETAGRANQLDEAIKHYEKLGPAIEQIKSEVQEYLKANGK